MQFSIKPLTTTVFSVCMQPRYSTFYRVKTTNLFLRRINPDCACVDSPLYMHVGLLLPVGAVSSACTHHEPIVATLHCMARVCHPHGYQWNEKVDVCHCKNYLNDHKWRLLQFQCSLNKLSYTKPRVTYCLLFAISPMWPALLPS